MTLEEYNRLLSQIEGADPITQVLFRGRHNMPLEPPAPPAKKKRRASKYNKEFAKQYKAMRKKHPRMTHGQITSKAHKAAKKALK